MLMLSPWRLVLTAWQVRAELPSLPFGASQEARALTSALRSATQPVVIHQEGCVLHSLLAFFCQLHMFLQFSLKLQLHVHRLLSLALSCELHADQQRCITCVVTRVFWHEHHKYLCV
jgi:hypothetical protein